MLLSTVVESILPADTRDPFTLDKQSESCGVSVPPQAAIQTVNIHTTLRHLLLFFLLRLVAIFFPKAPNCMCQLRSCSIYVYSARLILGKSPQQQSMKAQWTDGQYQVPDHVPVQEKPHVGHVLHNWRHPNMTQWPLVQNKSIINHSGPSYHCSLNNPHWDAASEATLSMHSEFGVDIPISICSLANLHKNTEPGRNMVCLKLLRHTNSQVPWRGQNWLRSGETGTGTSYRRWPILFLVERGVISAHALCLEQKTRRSSDWVHCLPTEQRGPLFLKWHKGVSRTTFPLSEKIRFYYCF